MRILVLPKRRGGPILDGDNAEEEMG